jgi:glucose-1-phosphate cytidylyltransferase
MKAFILAGGFGTRLGDVTENIPKPMVRIDDRPIIWHVMKIFNLNGINDIECLLGYKGDVIRHYLLNLGNEGLDFSLKLNSSLPDYRKSNDGRRFNTDLRVGCIETGLNSFTAKRIKIALESCDDETVIVTYGDVLANIDVSKLVHFHTRHGKLVTLTAVRPPARFGHLNIENGKVIDFEEKNQLNEGWINGGFMVIDRKALPYLTADEPFEGNPLANIANAGELMAFIHHGFWFPMDTPSDLGKLRELSKISPQPWLVLENNT